MFGGQTSARKHDRNGSRAQHTDKPEAGQWLGQEKNELLAVHSGLRSVILCFSCAQNSDPAIPTPFVSFSMDNRVVDEDDVMLGKACTHHTSVIFEQFVVV